MFIVTEENSRIVRREISKKMTEYKKIGLSEDADMGEALTMALFLNDIEFADKITSFINFIDEQLEVTK